MFAPLSMAKFIARIILSSEALSSKPKTLKGINFTFFAIPAIPSLLFIFAPIIPAIIVQCSQVGRLLPILSPTKSIILLAP